MQSSPYLARILRATKVDPVGKTDTSTQYQDYLKNRQPGKPPIGKKPAEKPEKNFREMVEKELKK